MEDQSLLVLGPDGTVLDVSGELSPQLVDTRLEECETLADEIRDAGAALLRQLRASGHRVVSRVISPTGAHPAVELIAIAAVPIRRTPTDLRQLLASKLAVLSFQAEAARVALRVDVADNVPPLVALDSEKIAWAVSTLVGNALRYIPAPRSRLGGHQIEVKATCDPSTREIAIEVKDDGPGIPADTVARLFKRDGLNVRGAGLALLVMRDVVAAHGGRIDVRSSTDPAAHGTAIRLMFPAD